MSAWVIRVVVAHFDEVEDRFMSFQNEADALSYAEYMDACGFPCDLSPPPLTAKPNQAEAQTEGAI